MELIEQIFPRYDQRGKELIYNAYKIAQEALKDQKRSNGAPFLEHPVAVARIACDEIGLSSRSHTLFPGDGDSQRNVWTGRHDYDGRPEQDFYHQSERHQT